MWEKKITSCWAGVFCCVGLGYWVLVQSLTYTEHDTVFSVWVMLVSSWRVFIPLVLVSVVVEVFVVVFCFVCSWWEVVGGVWVGYGEAVFSGFEFSCLCVGGLGDYCGVVFAVGDFG